MSEPYHPQIRPDEPEHSALQDRKNFASKLIEERQLPRVSDLERVMRLLSPGERMLLYVLSILLAGSALILLINVNRGVSAVVPSHGGKLVEGAIGTPRFINPLLAISQVDQDLTALIYSGLMRATRSGDLIPDLASDYEVSEDGTIYTFRLREDAVFHNGALVTAEDVVFTVALAQNQNIKSSRRADWDGVVASAPDKHTVIFTLPHAYAPFLENTQLGVLPKGLWENVSAEEFPFHPLNAHPVGSGPFVIKDIQTDGTGASHSYELSSFKDFTLGQPYLNAIQFRFFVNEQALRDAFTKAEIDSFAGVSPERKVIEDTSDVQIWRMPSTRIFGIFFNQNHAAVLSDASVRAALDTAVDRYALIDSVIEGYAKPAHGPIPPGLLSQNDAATTTIVETGTEADPFVEKARGILARGGWKWHEATSTDAVAAMSGTWQKGTKNPMTLSFALATADTPELAATAKAVAEKWRATGIDVSVHVYPLAEFNAAVLRPRNYDAVLFGEVVGRTLDLFAFWHSSQRNDPGLNLALYTNARADKLLATARTEVDRKEREDLYRSFSKIIAEDRPAVFLYAPEFIYVTRANLQGLIFGPLTSPSERFTNVHEWYTDTERVWNIFSSYPDLQLLRL